MRIVEDGAGAAGPLREQYQADIFHRRLDFGAPVQLDIGPLGLKNP